MASLDNFHTYNGSNRLNWPDMNTRMNALRRGLYDTSTNGDVASRVPVGPIQPSDQAVRLSNHPDPRYTERISAGVNSDMYVRTVPYTQRMKGDTVESNPIYERPCCLAQRLWQKTTASPNTVPVRTRNHQWQPY